VLPWVSGHCDREDTARELDCAARKAVATALSSASEILTTKREVLERCAAQLLVKEILDSNDLSGNIKPAPTEVRMADVPCIC